METITSATYPMKRVLVVEDDRTLQPIMRRMMHALNPNARIDWARSAEGARDLVRRHLRGRGYDLIVSDILLEGDETGLDFAEDCRRMNLRAQIVVTSGNCVVPQAGEMAHPFLKKPFNYPTFRECLAPFLLDATPPRSPPQKAWPTIAPWILPILAMLALLWLSTARYMLQKTEPIGSIPHAARFSNRLEAEHGSESGG